MTVVMVCALSISLTFAMPSDLILSWSDKAGEGAQGRIVGQSLQAWAIDEETQLTALELERQIESTQEAYAAAREEVDRANDAITANEERVAEIEREIPEQQKRSADATRDLYKFQQQSVGIVELLLESDSFFEFLSGFEYMNRIADANIDEINRLAALKSELEATRADLQKSYSEASSRANAASAAMDEALRAQAEVQRRIEEDARHEAEVAAAAAALAEEPRNNDEGVIESAPEAPAEAVGADGSAIAADTEISRKSAGGNEDEQAAIEDDAEDEPTASDDSDGSAYAATEEPAGELSTIDETLSEADSFVAEWAPRIDAYLSGSPMAGQGSTFAKAAFAYGVDPRFSPAISYTESSKGAVCFNSHNAWGWGSASWDSWEEAIDAHVSGLASGYGYTISEEGAKKYCPPNWEHWYNTTLAQMNLI